MRLSIQFEYPIIDVRSPQSYTHSHLANSANIPANQLEQRTHELPEKHIPINIVGEQGQVGQSVKLLQSKGYNICGMVDTAEQVLAVEFSQSNLTDGIHSKRFWRPASVIEHFCENFEIKGNANKALDLACGAGRDSIYLGLQGWQMTAIDTNEYALARVKGSAVRAGLEIDCRQLDLERNFDSLLEKQQTFDLIVVVRYLHRPLLSQLDSLLNNSGYLVYQTFMQGCEKFGSPKNPRFLLKANELSACFAEYKVLLDSVEYLKDERPVNSFIAQKRVE